MPSFTGFPAKGLAFLRELPSRDTAWFQANRATYQAELVLPAKAFVEDLGARLQQEVSPAIIALPRANGSIAPINNDVRFAKNKPAYKDHLLFRFWEGKDKKTAPTLFVRLHPESIGFATGAMFASVDAWRRRVDDEATGRPLADAIAKLEKVKPLDIAGAALKRVPAPYPSDHPRGDLLRHKMIQVRWPEQSPKSIGSARFTDWCLTRLRACTPIHLWLVENL
jgi:uncharacterized protein (TIGR02453 family)